jgi:hypothetical protein
MSLRSLLALAYEWALVSVCEWALASVYGSLLALA